MPRSKFGGSSYQRWGLEWAYTTALGGARLPTMTSPGGFVYRVVGDDVLISHHGRSATTLRGAAAKRFLVDVEDADPQGLMARVTGNYKRGNERTAKNHPRNRSR